MKSPAMNKEADPNKQSIARKMSFICCRPLFCNLILNQIAFENRPMLKIMRPKTNNQKVKLKIKPATFICKNLRTLDLRNLYSCSNLLPLASRSNWGELNNYKGPVPLEV